MPFYDVTMTVVVAADHEDDAYRRAVNGQYYPDMTIVEEDGIRRLPEPLEV